MLFTAKPGKTFAGPPIGAANCIAATSDKDWPLDPIEIVDGVPFLVAGGYNLGGVRGKPTQYVEYCLNNCDWNPYQFKPKTPEEQRKALEKLLATPGLKGIWPEAKEFLAAQIDRPDILIADFEGDDYGGWKTTGTAFGKGPAKGTLPDQMPVTGFLGKGLVNSYLGGDGSTGTLTSPPFKIERKYLNFLIGGGKHPGKTCINLLVGGKVVRTATGPNDRPGGSEHLDWHTWDVSESRRARGRSSRSSMSATGGWGHINVDHIVQTDQQEAAEPVTARVHRSTSALPAPARSRPAAPKRRMKFIVGRAKPCASSTSSWPTAKPDFWAFARRLGVQGEEADRRVRGLPADSKALADIAQSRRRSRRREALPRKAPAAVPLHRRGAAGSTTPTGWSTTTASITCSTSTTPTAGTGATCTGATPSARTSSTGRSSAIGLYPRKYGDWAFSGRAVVDKGNTSGWGTKEKPPLVLAYTSTGRGECIAYSTDKGRTWTEYDQNPVVKHQGRDPKLVWHEKSKHWVMAVYDEHDRKQWIAFYTSPDLKKWTFASRIEGFFECPDLFELNVSKYAIDDPEAKWVLYAADGKYLIGDFDGKEFKPDQREKKQLWYGNFYAAQTFDDGPGRRPGSADLDIGSKRIQIGWSQGVTFPGMPFNQQMTTPVYLLLCKGVDRAKPGELSLTANPVHELWGLREARPVYDLQGGQNQVVSKPTALADGLDAFDAMLSIELGRAKGFTIDLRGTKLAYDAEKQTLTCNRVVAPLKPHNGIVMLRVLVDRGSVEVFAPESAIAMSIAAIPDEKNRKLQVMPHGGDITIRAGNVYRMKSAWGKVINPPPSPTPH